MTAPVKNKVIVERFNRYINYRKTAERSGETFMDKLARSEKNAHKVGDGSSGHSHSHEGVRAGRRFAPPKIAARSKPLTQLQAQRLSRYAPAIESAAKKHGVPVELICGVILQESGGNAKAVSHAGARGLMQLMPATARRFGVNNSFDPVQNIEGGTKYLRFLLDRFKGNIPLALAGYNAGEGNVEKYGNKIPPFKETQAYVPNVLAYTQSMINIFYARLNEPALPSYAKRA